MVFKKSQQKSKNNNVKDKYINVFFSSTKLVFEVNNETKLDIKGRLSSLF